MAIWIVLTAGEVSRRLTTKPLLFKRRGLEGLYVFVDPSKRGLVRIVNMNSRYPPLQRSFKICMTPFLFAYSTNLAPLNFCIECHRYRTKRSCDTEDSSRATASVSHQGLYDRYGAICKKKRSKSFDLLL